MEAGESSENPHNEGEESQFQIQPAKVEFQRQSGQPPYTNTLIGGD